MMEKSESGGLDLQQAKKTLTQFVREVWSEGDIEASAKYLAPQYTIHHDPGDPWERQTLDLEGYKTRVARLRAAFPDQKFAIQDLLAEGNAIAITWLWKATHQGDIPGFSASDKPITMSGATVYYFSEDGRITGHWQITDRLGVFQQLQQNQGKP